MGLFSRRPMPLPRTSYGYVPPPEATASGWKCTDEDECGTGGQEIPRRWPYRCPNCGAETDPEFNEPWAHQARGAWLSGKAEDKSGEYPNGDPFWQRALASPLLAPHDAKGEPVCTKIGSDYGQGRWSRR